MTDFIEGAAYISPSRNKLYHGEGGCALRGPDGYLVDDQDLPDDLVMIWKPGDAVVPADNVPPGETTIVHYWDDSRPNPNWSRINLRSPLTGPDVVTIPCPDGKPDCAVLHTMPRDKWEAQNKQKSLKTRGWFYPTRYNETPGLYEDELENPEGFGNRWEYRDADPSGYGDAAKSWLEVDTGTWHAVPNDGASAVAVQWRCKLDA